MPGMGESEISGMKSIHGLDGMIKRFSSPSGDRVAMTLSPFRARVARPGIRYCRRFPGTGLQGLVVITIMVISSECGKSYYIGKQIFKTSCRIRRPCRNSRFTFEVILSPSLRPRINSAKNRIIKEISPLFCFLFPCALELEQISQ